ncbi:hypothetical protein AURANDRAFT_60473 [Aureococcus anophagefferens]|uniref:PX domain-containing protein n=1 Tax=Aureococcus anophagefferens TaxID=44056 RepID=F0XX97_AURAN|nr:hypothetical protein AURANDRAFT_60473 [Aureococcus anophagefferens]EGB12535.1 hypothetical protein AURANDRAFT_60473 [Aureococcus anophagefferens]|eukprot:XP_009032208.1 hypothetical protein AURANDRAFT_60473 [Aureococcus anophagefferens]
MYDVLVPSTKRDPREKKILYEIRVISEERCGRFEVKDRASKAWSVWKRWAECRKLSEALKSGVVVAGGLPPFPEHAKQAVLTLGKGSEKRQAELEVWLKKLFAALCKDRDIFYDHRLVEFFGGYICPDKVEAEVREASDEPIILGPPPGEAPAAPPPPPPEEKTEEPAASSGYPDYIHRVAGDGLAVAHPDEARPKRRPSANRVGPPKTFEIPIPGSLVRIGDDVIEPLHGWQGLESRNAVGVVVSSAFDQATKSTSVVVAFNAPARFVADVSELVAQDDDDAEADLVGRILNAHNDYEGLAYAKYKPHKPFKTTESSKAQSPRGYQFSDVIATPETIHLEQNESFTYVSTRTGAKTTYTYTTETEDYSTPAPEPPKSSSWLCAYPQADDATLTDEDEQIPIQRYPDAAGDGYEDDMFNIMLCNSSTVEAI